MAPNNETGLIPVKFLLHFVQARSSLRDVASSSLGEKDEPDFIETHCHWTDCDREFHSQDQLVKVS